MRLDRRQLVIGAAVVVVLGLAAWMLSRPAPPPRAAVPAQTRARAGRPGADVVVGPADPVKLAALKTSHDDPGQAGRNPFRFQPKPAPPPIKVAPKPVESETPRPTGPPTPTGPPPPAPIALKFVGVLERANGVKWAVLTDGKSAPMYGKDGDIIDGKYLIVKIGAESVEMTHVDGRGRQVIRLTGQ
jgi:hypothetical protein